MQEILNHLYFTAPFILRVYRILAARRYTVNELADIEGEVGICSKRSALCSLIGSVCRDFEVVAPVPRSVISAIRVVLNGEKILEYLRVFGAEFIIQEAHLTVNGILIQSVCGAIVAEIGTAAVMPLAKPVTGAAVSPDCGIEPGFIFHVRENAASCSGI